MMSLSELDKRELCPVHGWVGRAAFQRDRHDLCEPPVDDSPLVDEDEEEDNDDPPSRWTRAGARARGIPSKKTVAVRRITQLELRVRQAELRVLGADGPYDRPRTRGDCVSGQRPCPYVACKHNFFLDVSETGSIIFNFPHLEPDQMPPDRSCSLDLADRGGMTLEEVGYAQALTRERVRQVETKALFKLLARLKALGIDRSDVVAFLMRYAPGPGGELADSGANGERSSDIATILQEEEEP